MKKSLIFIDGATTGTTVDSNMRIETSLTSVDGRALRRVMKRAGAHEEKGELRYKVAGKSSAMVLSLRPGRTKTYFNLTGNPTTFLTQGNVWGYGDAGQQISKCFTIALSVLESNAGLRAPGSLKKMLRSGEINVHSLEFAAYTKELNKKRYLSSVQHVLGQGSRSGDQRTSICTMLGIRVTQSYDNQTIGLAFPYRKMGDEKKLLIYDKEAEIGMTEGKVQKFLRNRLRFDLHLDKLWFERRKIRTVADLARYMADHGGEARVVALEIMDCVERAALQYMFEIRRSDLKQWMRSQQRPEHLRPDLSYEAHLTMWAALQTDVEDDVKIGMLNSDPQSLLPLLRDRGWRPKLKLEAP